MMVYVDVVGGNGCGWGNMVFEGQCGLFLYLLVIIINGILGNVIFGMIFGINGCNINVCLGYGGCLIFVMNGMFDNIVEDMVKGQGEVFDVYVVLFGVEVKDWVYFVQVIQQYFGEIFVSKDVMGEQVLSNILVVMSCDGILVCYVK